MIELFLHFFNISVTASYIIIAVLLLRLLLKKFPKSYTCILWGIVALRLALPFKIESFLSLIPSGEPVSPQIFTYDTLPPVLFDTGFEGVDSVINPVAADYIASNKTPLETFMLIVSIVWIAVVACMLMFGLISYIRIKYVLRFSVKNESGNYNSEAVKSPFIFGIVKPRIYLPFNINNEDENIIVSHEKAHITRLDHLTKILTYVLLSVYWFNPLVWIYYLVLQRDIESACDQRVIKNMSAEAKKLYSVTLLKYSANNKFHTLIPVAFGEISVKQRIKSVMHYKKPTLWVTIAFVLIAVFTVLAFMTTPAKNNQLDTKAPVTSLNVTSEQKVQNNKDSSVVSASSQNSNSETDSFYTTTTTTSAATSYTTSKKPETNTSSDDKALNVPEKPALSYAELEKKAEKYLIKNNGLATPVENEFYYDLGNDVYIIPTEFVALVPQKSYMITLPDNNGKEHLNEVIIYQAKDYTYPSKVLESLRRDLKIIEEFAGIKPTSFVFKNVKDNKTFKNVSDIPDDYFKTFSRGSHLSTVLTVYFEDDNKTDPCKVTAEIKCYTDSTTWAFGHPNRLYTYSIRLSVRYNRDFPH